MPRTKHKAAPKRSAYDDITARILAELEKGRVPWRQPWPGGWPRNLDDKRYRGQNVLLLLIAPYSSQHWGTFKAVNDHGGRVRRGERGTSVYVWRPETEEETRRRLERLAKGVPEGSPVKALRDTDSHWIVSSHTLFNVEQCDGLEHLDAPTVTREITPIAAADALIAAMPNRPSIREAGERAFWLPSTDTITVPHRASFVSDAAYYSTLFHELTHSTAHASRLGRSIEGYSFDRHVRSEEELVAEIGASFLRAEAGIDSPDDDTNSAAYIADWMSQIRADKMLVSHAARAAQKAADFIVGRRGADDSASPGADASLKQAA